MNQPADAETDGLPTSVGPAPVVGYVEGLERGELRFVRCHACGQASFYPRVLCPRCGSTDIAWERSAGRGTVYSATTVVRPDASYNVALVDLDEGFRIMSTVVGVDEPQIGARVLLALPEEYPPVLRPVFRSDDTDVS